MTVICDYCGRRFMKYSSQLRERNYCCKECFEDHQRETQSKKVTVTCAYCGKEFEKQVSVAGRTTYHFCSRRCWAAFGNKSLNPNGYTLLGRNSDNARKKISEANRNRILSDAAKEKIRDKALGRKMPDETRAKIRESMRGREVSNETRIKLSLAKRTDSNYTAADCEEHEFYSPYRFRGGKLEHRFVMEQVLKRQLLPQEVVHHVDGDPCNNSPDNLQLFSSMEEHSCFHQKLSAFWFSKGKKEGGDAR